MIGAMSFAAVMMNFSAIAFLQRREASWFESHLAGQSHFRYPEEHLRRGLLFSFHLVELVVLYGFDHEVGVWIVL